MTTLFPPAEAFRTHWLPVDGGHRLFVAEYGRPDGRMSSPFNAGYWLSAA